MLTLFRLVSLAAIAISLVDGLAISLRDGQVVPPASQGQPDAVVEVDITGTTTDTDNIVSTASQIDQKSGASTDAPPNLSPPTTSLTVLDGDQVNTTVADVASSTNSRRSLNLAKRLTAGYEQVFSGTGTGPDDRDASIEGTAYLTYTVVDNSTYSVDQCLQFCDQIDACVFVNLYYEFNNPLLDFVLSEKSNLKCAAYADVHIAAEKTNKGGQQLEDAPAGLTYIQESSGYYAKDLADPDTPEGYDLVFGPTNGANNAPGYMGFAFLDRYDVQACADLCNSRGADSVGGGCQYFNIWRAVVNGRPTTYTCSMYYLVADESTAVNFGQGDLKVTQSRGYSRKNILPDGGFEGYNECGNNFCFTSGYSNWKGLGAGVLDATIFHFNGYSRTGQSVGLLGSASGSDNLPGTLTPSQPLQTVAGQTYSLQFFLNSDFSGHKLQQDAFVDVRVSGTTLDTIRPSYSHWTFYQYTFVAKGNDVLEFHGGKAPAWNFIDDISVFLA